jgi:hypothetical protein
MVHNNFVVLDEMSLWLKLMYYCGHGILDDLSFN